MIFGKPNYLFRLVVFSYFMSRNRFLLLLRTLHFNQLNEKVTQNSMQKISPLQEQEQGNARNLLSD